MALLPSLHLTLQRIRVRSVNFATIQLSCDATGKTERMN